MAASRCCTFTDFFQIASPPRRPTASSTFSWKIPDTAPQSLAARPGNWRDQHDPASARIFRRFDILSPWNVGNTMIRQGDTRASTAHWKDDNIELMKSGKRFLPVVYPGFSWDNLTQKPPGTTEIPRYGGNFYWDQFSRVIDAGADMAYVAMFDEVDEGTAIFKVTNDPPRQGNYVTYDGFPSDWYLRLTGEASKMIRGERKYIKVVPIKPR